MTAPPPSQCTTSCLGLQPKIRWQMAIYDDTASLESFLLKAQTVSQHLTAVTVTGNTCPDTSSHEEFSAPEPMQMDEYHLSLRERQRRLQRGLCLYCGEPHHSISTCPVRPLCLAVSTIHLSSILHNPSYHDATLIVDSCAYPQCII